MALVIDGVTEAQLDLLAKKQGVSPLDLAKRLIADASAEESDPILQWLDATEQNWETSDPAEVAKREAEGEVFMRELAAGRELTHGPDARKL